MTLGQIRLALSRDELFDRLKAALADPNDKQSYDDVCDEAENCWLRYGVSRDPAELERLDRLLVSIGH